MGWGITPMCWVHRLPGADGHPKDIALTDGLAAISAICGERPLVLFGLSSGGHLAGTLACQPGVEAKGVVIAYAPINANHKDYKAPRGKPDYPPAEKQAFYNDWPIGIAALPHGVPGCPVFLAYALADAVVPVEHALNFITTARDLGLDLDAHIFGQAPHGFALRGHSQERRPAGRNWRSRLDGTQDRRRSKNLRAQKREGKRAIERYLGVRADARSPAALERQRCQKKEAAGPHEHSRFSKSSPGERERPQNQGNAGRRCTYRKRSVPVKWPDNSVVVRGLQCKIVR